RARRCLHPLRRNSPARCDTSRRDPRHRAFREGGQALPIPRSEETETGPAAEDQSREPGRIRAAGRRFPGGTIPRARRRGSHGCITTAQSEHDASTVTTRIVDHYDGRKRAWVKEAVRLLHAGAARCADTHVFQFPLPRDWGIDLYVKDESVHPSGSLKHRMARALFLHALCTGWIEPDTHVFEASSGSTAVSEAYFAQLLGLKFTAVVPASTSREKVELIKAYGGEVQNPGPDGDIEKTAARLAEESPTGHFMDQFTYAERAYDYRDDHNVAATIFRQIAEERHPDPKWIVVGAGTGGTSA